MLDLSQTEASQPDMERLAKAMTAVQRETPRNAMESVRYAAVMVARSGRAASKPSKKNRDYYDLEKDQSAPVPLEQRTKRYAIIVPSQDGTVTFLPADIVKDPRREIQMRGLARNTWSYMMGKLGASKGKVSPAGGARRVFVKQKLNPKLKEQMVGLFNRLSYLKAAYPGIEERAVRKGTNALFNMLDRRTGRTLKHAFD